MQSSRTALTRDAAAGAETARFASRVGAADIALVIDRAYQVATLRAGEFVHPLLCESAGQGALVQTSTPP